MSDQAVFGIRIVGNNQTDKGARAAERRLGQVPRRVGDANRRYERESVASMRRVSRSTLRTFGEVERAGAQLLGGRAIASGAVSRLGGLTQAAGAVAGGLGEATAGAGLLSGGLGILGVAAGATIGILAAAGYAAFKLADGWAKGAASIGRTASIIGVATKDLQEFSAAAERAGVDKDKATGSLGSLSQTLNDARYGRNTQALEVLKRLGVEMKTNKDGTVDVGAMLVPLADALQSKNSSGRRTAARILGIDLAALPAFTQGGKQLGEDMRDADQHAVVLTDKEIERGARIERKGVRVGQLKDRVMSKAGAWTAEKAEVGYDAVLRGGEAMLDGAGEFADSVSRSFKPAAEKIERAADRIGTALKGGAIGITRQAVAAAQHTERKYGVPASITLAQYGLESSFGRRMPRGSNNPFGIKAVGGQPYVTARTTEVDRSGRSYRTTARFRKFESLEAAFEEHGRLLARGRAYARARRALPNVDAYADALTGTYATDRRYGQKLRGVINQHGLRQYDGAVDAIPVKVEIDMRGAPQGTRATVTAGRSARPAISRAMAD